MKKRIGIFAYRGEKGFSEPDFLEQLVRNGQQMDAEVFVFSPQDVCLDKRRIKGFTPAGGRWASKWYPWPDIVIDRYRYYPLPKHKAYLPFREQNLFHFANSRFANKFRVHQVLAEDPKLSQWLPETHPFDEQTLKEMLHRHRIIYVKPTNGTGGRSILRIEHIGKGYLLHGQSRWKRSSNTRIPTQAALIRQIRQWTNREKFGEEQFFLQQGLDLELLPNRTVDVRLLIQKDGEGMWKIAGIGARIGKVNASTSNLHAGGTAAPALRFLTSRFGNERARLILAECRELALCAVEKIEQHYGPMMEFGFDIGIDVNGSVWLIEINPKPGREILLRLGLHQQYQKAVSRPIEYALYLLRKKESEDVMQAPEEDVMQVTEMGSGRA